MMASTFPAPNSGELIVSVSLRAPLIIWVVCGRGASVGACWLRSDVWGNHDLVEDWLGDPIR